MGTLISRSTEKWQEQWSCSEPCADRGQAHFKGMKESLSFRLTIITRVPSLFANTKRGTLWTQWVLQRCWRKWTLLSQHENVGVDPVSKVWIIKTVFCSFDLETTMVFTYIPTVACKRLQCLGCEYINAPEATQSTTEIYSSSRGLDYEALATDENSSGTANNRHSRQSMKFSTTSL